MDNSAFSVEKIRELFEAALPENVTIRDFRDDLNRVLLLLCPRDLMGNIILAHSPKEAFDRVCMDVKFKQALCESYEHKFEVDFYDLICLSTLILNEENQMLSQFLCTEILQTSFDTQCQQVCINRLQKIINSNSDRDDADNNLGIHSSICHKIGNYDKFKEFLNISKSRYSEFEVDFVEFGEDIINISVTSIAEYICGDNMEFGTSYPVATLKVELSSIFNIFSDTNRWRNLGYGKLYILPTKTSSNEDAMEFSFIHEPSDSAYFKIKCKDIKITDYSELGVDFGKKLNF